MKKFIIFFIIAMISWISFAQTKTNIVQEGYYHVVSGLDTISSHSTKDNAIESMLNEKLKGVEDVKILVPEIRVDIEGLNIPPSVSDTIYITERVTDTIHQPGEIVEVTKPSEIDTVIANLCFDILGKKQWFHAGDDPSIWPHPIYMPTKEYSMMRVMFYDTLTTAQKIYQTKWKFKRKKDFANATTTYGTTGETPFQFYIRDSVVGVEQNVIRVRVFASEDWIPEYIVNGVSRGKLLNSSPGSPVINEMPMRRHTCTIDGLLPDTEYTIIVKGYAREDETQTDETTFTLRTLP